MEKKVNSGGYSPLNKTSIYNSVGYFDTGNVILNWAISGDPVKGGYPKGKVIELYGDPSTGKSLLALTAISTIQKAGGVAVLDDVEYAFSQEFANKLGVNTEKDFYIGNSTNIENWTEVTSKMIDRLKELGVKDALFVVDSIAQLSTIHEEETPVETRDMSKAYYIRKALRLLMPKFATSSYTLLVLNHSVSNIGNVFNPKVATGGSGVKFSSSVRVELSFMGKYPQGKGNITEGVFSKFYISKNRVSVPFKSGIIYIDFRKGVSKYSGVFDTLVSNNIISCEKGARKVIIAGKEVTRANFDDRLDEIAKQVGYNSTEEFLISMLNKTEEPKVNEEEREEE